MESDLLGTVKNELTEYGKSLGKYGELRLVGIISRLLGMFLLIFTVVLCALALFTFAAFAIIDLLANYMPVWAASMICGSIYVVFIIIAIVCRRPLFINPFIKLLTQEIETEEELAIKTAEAEHHAELQRVRMECQMESATREFDFYVKLLSRFWDTVRRLWARR